MLQRLRDGRVQTLHCRFMDFPGRWQQVSFAVATLRVDDLQRGFGFDGSLLQGWRDINEGDMVLVPDPATLRPCFPRQPSSAAGLPDGEAVSAAAMSVVCDIKDPVTRKTYSRDPRSIARRAEAVLTASGLADTAYFAPELEFFVFDRVRFDQRPHTAYYELDTAEGSWTRGRRSDIMPGGLQMQPGQGMFPLPPQDTLLGLREQIVRHLGEVDIPVRCHHHEVAPAGQCEIDLAHLRLLEAADALTQTRQIVRETAAANDKVVTFMPKPMHGCNGSGLHVHFSLFKDGSPLFAGRLYAGLSREALHAVGGLMRHGPALLAFTNPTVNSFKRLRPGFEAPTRLSYASRNRDAAIRIPVYHPAPDRRRLELRFPDPLANPYLAYAAITLAAVDGIRNAIDPGEPMDLVAPPRADSGVDPESQARGGRTCDADEHRLPNSLDGALAALERDHAFLTADGVFPDDVIQAWIRNKRQQELEILQERIHPMEYCLYFDQ